MSHDAELLTRLEDTGPLTWTLKKRLKLLISMASTSATWACWLRHSPGRATTVMGVEAHPEVRG